MANMANMAEKEVMLTLDGLNKFEKEFALYNKPLLKIVFSLFRECFETHE